VPKGTLDHEVAVVDDYRTEIELGKDEGDQRHGPVADLAMNRRTLRFPRVFARIAGFSHLLPHPKQPDRSVALVDDRPDIAEWTIVGLRRD
jgi:hypothetical protein